MARITPWLARIGSVAVLLSVFGCGGAAEPEDPLERVVAGMGVHEQAAHTIVARLLLQRNSVAPDLPAHIATC